MINPGTLAEAFLIGGLVYWYRGQGRTKIPKPILQALFAFPYAVVTLHHGLIIAAANWIVTTFAVWTGHGNWQSPTQPSEPPPGAKQERLEFLIYWLKPYLSDYCYKVTGLTLTSLAVTLPTALIERNPYVALTALCKPAAYMIGAAGQKLLPMTQFGEAGTGAGMWSTLLLTAP